MENKTSELDKINQFLKKEKIDYKNIRYYQIAFMHPSFFNEHRNLNLETYDRYEFLGDSIIDFIISYQLFSLYPNYSSGDLTMHTANIVKKSSLALVAKEMEIEQYVLVGKGELNNYISDNLLCDFFESFIAAIFLDLGFNKAKDFVLKKLDRFIKDTNNGDYKDYKTKLQEIMQVEKKSVTYETVKKELNNNQSQFESIAYIDDLKIGRGVGKTKQDAEKEAAKSAFNKLIK